MSTSPDPHLETVVLGEDELTELLGRDALHTLAAYVHQAAGIPEPPARGSQEYRAALRAGLRLTDVDELAAGLRALLVQYGWKAIADYLELVAEQLDDLLPARCFARDGFGRIRIDRLVRRDPGEEYLLSMAVSMGEDPDAATYGVDFKSAYEYGKVLVANNRAFLDAFQAALDHRAHGRPHMVWPTLASLPNLRDGHEAVVLPSAFTLALAALSVRAPRQVAEQMRQAGVRDAPQMPAREGARGKRTRR